MTLRGSPFEQTRIIENMKDNPQGIHSLLLLDEKLDL